MKQKDCTILNGWIKSIVNHLWWCCETCEGDEVELKEKWLHLLCHMVSKHNWGNATKYTKCMHSDWARETREKWHG